MLTNHCMYLQWYLELLSASCGFNSRREQVKKAAMFDYNSLLLFLFYDAHEHRNRMNFIISGTEKGKRATKGKIGSGTVRN